MCNLTSKLKCTCLLNYIFVEGREVLLVHIRKHVYNKLVSCIISFVNPIEIRYCLFNKDEQPTKKKAALKQKPFVCDAGFTLWQVHHHIKFLQKYLDIYVYDKN